MSGPRASKERHKASFHHDGEEWIASCCDRRWTGEDYGGAEDGWLDHIEQETGTRPQPMGRGELPIV